jgi:hypothetical protein
VSMLVRAEQASVGPAELSHESITPVHAPTYRAMTLRKSNPANGSVSQEHPLQHRVGRSCDGSTRRRQALAALSLLLSRSRMELAVRRARLYCADRQWTRDTAFLCDLCGVLLLATPDGAFSRRLPLSALRFRSAGGAMCCTVRRDWSQKGRQV